MRIIPGSFFVLAVLLLMSVRTVWSTMNIKVSDTRENNFYMEVLNLILDKSGVEYNLIHMNYPVSSQKRKVALLKRGEIDILYAGTSLQLETELLPIRFPIMRGLAGHRLFIIHRKYQADYDLVKNLNDLKMHTGVQGIGWGDKQVLEASGLNQVTKLYDDIFYSINAGSRFYFPRGVTEVFSELIDKRQKMPNLVVEKRVVLVYKTAVFFFVNHANSELANILNTGFKNAYKDGSYRRFLYHHPLIKSSMEQANLQNRIRIEITNPFLSSDTDAIPKQYWHQEKELSK